MDDKEIGEFAREHLPMPKGNTRQLIASLIAAVLGVAFAPWYYIALLILVSGSYHMTRDMLLYRRVATPSEATYYMSSSLIVNGGMYLVGMGIAWAALKLGYPIGS